MIRIGLYGYGNLAKGAEKAIAKNKDMELVAVFTRRNPKDVKIASDAEVVASSDVLKYKNKIDVMIICGGSATDLPTQTPELAKYFNCIDSFDTHAKVYEHYQNVDKEATKAKKITIISTGWDPGMFSLNRGIMEAILPDGASYTFWGKGVSQGHSDAIRRIDGVIDARQYTVPIDEALDAVRSGKNPTFTARQMHKRECYVVAKEGADLARIEKEIKEMPNYFADYDTTVNFISLEELKKNHNGIPHGGFVIRSGKTSDDVNHVIEYKLKLDSNPEFTGSILVAYARAAYKLNSRRECGARTVFDISVSDLTIKTTEELLKHTL